MTRRLLYHVLSASDVGSVLEGGLQPRIGPRSTAMGETEPAIHLFPSPQAVENALANWLGEEMADDELMVLQVLVPEDARTKEGAGFEAVLLDPVPASSISIYEEDADDLPRPSSFVEGRMAFDEEAFEAAGMFAMERWVERCREKWPNRDLPVDLSSSCKFTSRFVQTLFGGRLVVNERHQFVCLEDGRILDLNRSAADVMSDPRAYEDDASMPHEREWRESMASVEDRIEAWAERFVEEHAPRSLPTI